MSVVFFFFFVVVFLFFFFNDTATTEIYTLSLHDALPISLFLLLNLVSLVTMFSKKYILTRNDA